MLPGPRNPQMSFADMELSQWPASDILAGLAAAIDWPCLNKELATLYPSDRGRPAYPPLILFKALLLRRWFALSDPALEAGLRDRLSWKRFCGLSVADSIPDATTFCRFRRRLTRAFGDSLFLQVEKELATAKLLLPRL
jgi:IS5 family transposase